MTAELAIRIMAELVSLAVFLQACEFLALSRQKSFQRIWRFDNLKSDLEAGLPLPAWTVRLLFADSSFRYFSFLQIALSLCCFFLASPFAFLGLIIIQLLICVRFRGTFNGGSDMMIFVVLTGLVIASWQPGSRLTTLGLLYIAIHATYSYWRAGFSKIIQKEWRSGAAIPEFLNRGLFPSTQGLAQHLLNRTRLPLVLSWTVMALELSIPMIFFSQTLAAVALGFALLFHLTNWLLFGLNRFFWAWIAAWPAVIFAVHLLHPR